jgi:hypothetical protein
MTAEGVFFAFAGINLAGIFFTFLFVPETKGGPVERR